MEVSRGANLVGMSVFPLDIYPYSLHSQKKKNNLVHLTKLSIKILTLFLGTFDFFNKVTCFTCYYWLVV